MEVLKTARENKNTKKSECSICSSIRPPHGFLYKRHYKDIQYALQRGYQKLQLTLHMLKQYEGIIQLISYNGYWSVHSVQCIYPCMQTGTVNYSKKTGIHSVTNHGIVLI